MNAETTVTATDAIRLIVLMFTTGFLVGAALLLIRWD